MESNNIYTDNLIYVDNENNNQQTEHFSISNICDNLNNFEFTTKEEICEPNFRTQEEINKLRFGKY